ncbi:Uncharacterised protein [uncultured archaeon]|nr:Uncharacterised protein [uncultured archaeon]
MKFFDFDGKRYYVYLIEKLNEMPNFDEGYDLREFALHWELPMEQVISNYCAKYMKENLETFFEIAPDMLTALRIIGKYNHGYHIDIKPNNIMRRKDGTIVLTDPLATL